MNQLEEESRKQHENQAKVSELIERLRQDNVLKEEDLKQQTYESQTYKMQVINEREGKDKLRKELADVTAERDAFKER